MEQYDSKHDVERIYGIYIPGCAANEITAPIRRAHNKNTGGMEQVSNESDHHLPTTG